MSPRGWLSALAVLLGAAGHAHAQSGGLPVIEAPAQGRGDTLVVLYSGDGGWASIDRAVAGELSRRGFPVLGVDALRYFARRRSPDEAAADLAATIERYGRAWGRPRVVLAGYSFGADVLPLIVPRLPPAIRREVRLVAMISPDDTGRLVFHPGDWLGLKAADDVPLAPALAAMGSTPTLCIGAEADVHDACRAFAPTVTHVAWLPGGHHFEGRYPAVAATIAEAIGG